MKTNRVKHFEYGHATFWQVQAERGQEASEAYFNKLTRNSVSGSDVTSQSVISLSPWLMR